MADISKITLPSGNTYNIKDETARQMIAGGVSFEVVWTSANYSTATAPSATKLASIPDGVVVKYNQGASSATGTKAASASDQGKFILVYSPNSESKDGFDEYVVISETASATPLYMWEKIGATDVDLTGLVNNVTLNKQTTSFVTGYNSPTTDTVLGTGTTFSVTSGTVSVTPTTRYLSASFSDGSVTPTGNSSVITGYSDPSSASVIGTSSTFKITQPTITLASNTATATGRVQVATDASATTSKLSTTTVTGVQSSTTTASKATAGTSQTTATGAGTSSTTNTDWLKGVSVSDETLVIGAATMNTQTTTQFTFSDVTVPIKNTSATTVATGSLSASGSGSTVATGVSASKTYLGATATGANTAWNNKDSKTALTGLGTPSTVSALTSDTTFAVSGSVDLTANTSSATGRIQYMQAVSSASLSNTGITVSTGDQVTALTGLGTASTSAGLNNSTTITVDKNE